MRVWLGLIFFCAGVATTHSGPDGKNLIVNSSFEEGRKPFFSLSDSSPYWRDFSLSASRAKSGKHSARLDLSTDGKLVNGTRVWGVIQEFDQLDTLPRRIAGNYRIENWMRGTQHQYLQVVVILFPEKKGFPMFREPTTPLQMAFVLDGITERPFGITNRKFDLSNSQKDVRTDQWVTFDFDLHRSFTEHWGSLPSDFQKLRVLFEVRFDRWNPKAGDLPISGTVFYDDLYLGD